MVGNGQSVANLVSEILVSSYLLNANLFFLCPRIITRLPVLLLVRLPVNNFQASKISLPLMLPLIPSRSHQPQCSISFIQPCCSPDPHSLPSASHPDPPLDIERIGENGNLVPVEIFPRGVKGCGAEKMKRAHQGKSLWECVCVCPCVCVRERNRQCVCD